MIKHFYLSSIVNLQIDDVLEDERVADRYLSADVLVHGVDVCLVDGHAPLGQLGGVVDGDVVKIGILAPILI